MDIYLDIDGVILTKDHTQPFFLKEFLTWLLAHHTVYWLSTHCKGDTTHLMAYLSQFLDAEIFNLVKSIRPTNWERFKTDAIDFSSKFVWLDDYIFEKEKEVLRKENALTSWIPMDLKHNPKQLKEVYDVLRGR